MNVVIQCQLDSTPTGWSSRVAELDEKGRVVAIVAGLTRELSHKPTSRMNLGCMWREDTGEQVFWDTGSPCDPNVPVWWITHRTGGVYRIEKGTRKDVQALCTADNAHDAHGTTEILSGPLSRREAIEEFARLN